MPCEPQAYRANLERIKAAYPDKEMLNIGEVKRFLGIDREVVKRRFSFRENYISVATLAWELSI